MNYSLLGDIINFIINYTVFMQLKFFYFFKLVVKILKYLFYERQIKLYQNLLCLMILIKFFRCGKMVQFIRIVICCIILILVCFVCQDFLFLYIVFKKGNNEGMFRVEVIIVKVLVVVLRIYSFMLFILGFMVEIIVVRLVV